MYTTEQKLTDAVNLLKQVLTTENCPEIAITNIKIKS